MCQRREEARVRVKICPDLACSGKAHWKYAMIDWCVAPLVRALQRGGIDMHSSCCGHGRTTGSIDLHDGRSLLILERPYVLRFNAKAGEPEEQAKVLLAALRGEPCPGLPEGLL